VSDALEFMLSFLYRELKQWLAGANRMHYWMPCTAMCLFMLLELLINGKPVDALGVWSNN
jgi:hypothetical protein